MVVRLNESLSKKELHDFLKKAEAIDRPEAAFGFITNVVNQNPGKEARRDALREYIASLIDELDDFDSALAFVWARNHRWNRKTYWLLINNSGRCLTTEDEELDNEYKRKLRALFYETRENEKSIIRMNNLIEVGPPDILSFTLFERTCIKAIRSTQNIESLEKVIEEMEACKLKWFGVENNSDNAMTIVDCPGYAMYRPTKNIFCDNADVCDALCAKIEELFYKDIVTCKTKEETILTVKRYPQLWFHDKELRKRMKFAQEMLSKT